MPSNADSRRAAFDHVNRQQHYAAHLKGLSAHERHLAFLRNYTRFYGGGEAPDPKSKVEGTDFSALQAGHRFIRSAKDDATDTWAARLAQRYYQRLFKEYCIADLSRYKESQLGLRWRTEKEVVSGKGQFICGAKGCDEKAGLCSYEVNFAYVEAGERKQALVKLRVCPACAFKLNYKREKAYSKAAAQAAGKAAPGGAGRKRGAEEEEEDGGREVGSSKRANLQAAEELLARVLAGGDAGAVGTSGAQDGSAQRESVAPPPGRAQQQQQQQQAGGSGADQAASVLPGDDSIWEQRPAQEAATTAEEDFDQYFEGLFA